MKKVNKIVIFRLNSIGDIILTSALVRCLKIKFSESQISFVILKEFKDLVECNPAITEVITFDKKEGFRGLLKLRKEIKNKKFDWFIDIHNNIRSNIVKRGNGIPLKTRHHKILFARSLLIYFKINLYTEIKPIYLRFFEAVSGKRVKYDGKGTEVFIQGPDIDYVDSLLTANGYNKNNIAVICPGSKFTNKQWPLEGFAAVAKYMKLEKGFQVVLLGGKDDHDACEQINKISDDNFLNLAGVLKLPESAALLKLSKITITNDSGMMHMAQALKSPVVAIFGPTTKELGYFPIPERSRVVEVNLSCRPCTHTGLNYCPKKHFKCMKMIDSQMVINRILELLN